MSQRPSSSLEAVSARPSSGRSALALPLVVLMAAVLPSSRTDAYDNGLGLTPPMGWNTWNRFHCDIDEALVRETARVMVDSGLHKRGYQYVNLDDCWQVSRDSSGHIIEDRKKFPSGIPALAEYVHSLGLKFGLYSDSGLLTCQGRPGGLYFETQDAATYTAWRVDYLKYDNCFAQGQGPVQGRYQRMHDALNATGTPIFFSMCEWGVEDPALWARPVGNSWRTTQDIEATWTSILQCLDQNDQWHGQAGPGGFNDPDMLQVGNGELTISEQRAHFTLWCLVKAPLLLGNDLRNMTQDLMEIITNDEVIAWNQDPLGIQGYRRWSSSSAPSDDSPADSLPHGGGGTRGGAKDASNQEEDNEKKKNKDDGALEVWAGDLAGGDVAVVLLNRSEKEQVITALFHDVGICPCCTKAVMVRDVWAHQDLGPHQLNVSAAVPPHDAVALRLTPVTSMTTKVNDGCDCCSRQAQTK
jgi:alpha-galactosidase